MSKSNKEQNFHKSLSYVDPEILKEILSILPHLLNEVEIADKLFADGKVSSLVRASVLAEMCIDMVQLDGEAPTIKSEKDIQRVIEQIQDNDAIDAEH